MPRARRAAPPLQENPGVRAWVRPSAIKRCHRARSGARRHSVKRICSQIAVSFSWQCTGDVTVTMQQGRCSYLGMCFPPRSSPLFSSYPPHAQCQNRLKMGELGEGGDGRDDLDPRRGSSVENAVFGVLFTLRYARTCARQQG